MYNKFKVVYLEVYRSKQYDNKTFKVIGKSYYILQTLELHLCSHLVFLDEMYLKLRHSGKATQF